MTARAPQRVSICIPTYNYGRFITDAIESVLAQSFGDFELIVVDNCSEDDTRAIVESYARRDSRVSYHCNERNLGMVGNWNRCLELARCDYVKILCADDLIEPRCLELSVRLLDADSRTTLVSGSRQLVSKELQPIETLSYSDHATVVEGTEVISRCLLHGNLIGEPTAVLFRKSVAERGFDVRYKQLPDLELWFHLLEQGRFAFIQEPLCKFRQHEEQATKKFVQSLDFLDDAFLLFREYMGKRYVTLSLLQKHLAQFNLVYYVWKNSDDRSSAEKRAIIGRHYNLLSFYCLLVLKKLSGSFSR